MKKEDKINYLKNNYLGEWLKSWNRNNNILSEKQSMFCVCGKLATGLHERSCKKFNDAVNNSTLQDLNYLLTTAPPTPPTQKTKC
jgi:hypothetical protein